VRAACSNTEPLNLAAQGVYDEGPEVLEWLAAACPQLVHLEMHIADKISPAAGTAATQALAGFEQAAAALNQEAANYWARRGCSVTQEPDKEPQEDQSAAGEGHNAAGQEQAASVRPSLTELAALRSLKIRYYNAAVASLGGMLRRLPAMTDLSLDYEAANSIVRKPMLTAVAAVGHVAGQLTSLRWDCCQDNEPDDFQWDYLLEEDVMGEVGANDFVLEASSDKGLLNELQSLLPPTGQVFASLQHLELVLQHGCIHDGAWEALRCAACPGGALPSLTHLKVDGLHLYRSSTDTATEAAGSTLQRLTLRRCSLRTLGNLRLGGTGSMVQHLECGTLECDLDFLSGLTILSDGTAVDGDFLQLVAARQMALASQACANLATACGGTPRCHAPEHGELTLWYHLDNNTLKALLQVVPFIAGVRTLTLMGRKGAEEISALADAPLLPPTITTLDLSSFGGLSDDAWSMALPTLTASPSLVGFREVVFDATITEQQLQEMCCAPGVARPIVVRVVRGASTYKTWLSTAQVGQVRDAVAAAGMSDMVTIV
jgi:hypothetical protein